MNDEYRFMMQAVQESHIKRNYLYVDNDTCSRQLLDRVEEHREKQLELFLTQKELEVMCIVVDDTNITKKSIKKAIKQIITKEAKYLMHMTYVYDDRVNLSPCLKHVPEEIVSKFRMYV